MPFFNFRRTGSSSAPNAAANAQPDSLEVIRKRAKHRLIGAAVLVLVGIVGFPLLFDTQPRPIAVDIPIEIPGKNMVKPLVLPVPPLAPLPVTPPAAGPPTVPAPAAAVAAPTPASEKISAAASLTPTEEILTEKKAIAPVAPKPPAIKKEAVVLPKPEPKPEPRAKAAAADDGARARALLRGEDAPVAAVPAGDARIVVQVGAFADAVKAREVRLKLEKAGLKTYTQVADTATGKRIRVRVGPFANRAEAEKAASKIKTLDLPAAILTL